MGAAPGEGTTAVPDVGVDLVPEVLLEGDDRRNGGRAERADRGHLGRPVEADAEPVRDVDEQIEVDCPPLPLLDPAQDHLHPGRALTTGRALAARLVGVEATARSAPRPAEVFPALAETGP